MYKIKKRKEVHAKTQKLFFDRTKSGKVDFNKNFSSIESMQVAPQNGVLKLDIFVDNSIVEVFANERQAISRRVYPEKKGNGISLLVTTYPCRLISSYQ